MNNWTEVSAERLAANFHLLQTVAGPATTVLAVIKANAYGHGAERCAPILARAGAQWLGVTCAGEGARVRHALLAAGIEQPAQPDILIMSGFLPEDVPLIHQYRLTPVLWTPEQIAWLGGHAVGLRIHLEVDTGMGRQGVTPGRPLAGLLQQITQAGLVLDGVFTHLCSSELANSPVTILQRERFEAVVARLQSLNATPRFLHIANSSALDRPTDPDSTHPGTTWLTSLAARLGAAPMVRPGLALYGYTLPVEVASPGTQPRLHAALQPVLTWNAHVLAMRDLTPGETVGYNATFTATRPMSVALLPVGYADGLRRELSSTTTKPGGWVIIHNHRAPILGRISMNLTVVDVSAIPDVQPGHVATLLGEGITADDHATLAHTIAYEILCNIHPCT